MKKYILTLTEEEREALGKLTSMDQASPDKGILRHQRERGKDPDMDSHFRLRAGGHHQEALEAGAESLHNFTDSECHPFREDAHFTGAFSCGIRE